MWWPRPEGQEEEGGEAGGEAGQGQGSCGQAQEEDQVILMTVQPSVILLCCLVQG